jgi:hypothetical protein
VAGLVLLEHARRQRWAVLGMGLGAAVLTYAATVHYSLAPMFLGAAAYATALFLERPARWRLALGALILGGCVVGIVYLAAFVIPNRSAIQQAFSASNAAGDFGWALRENFSMYAGAALPFRSLAIRQSALGAWLAYVIFASGIPLFLVVQLFAVRKETRLLALATLPLSLFLFFVARRKLLAYHYVEIVLLYTVVAAWLASLGVAIAQRLRTPAVGKAMLACLGLMLFVVSTPQLKLVQPALRPQVHEFDFARAVSKLVLGSRKRVMSQSSLWYLSGATTWLDLTRDLLWKLPPEGATSFVRSADAIAVLHENYLEDHSGMNEVTLYSRRDLRLLGFYFAETGAYKWSWLVPTPVENVQGVFWENGSPRLFKSGKTGSQELMTLRVVAPNPDELPRFVSKWKQRLGARVSTYLLEPMLANGESPAVVMMLIPESTPQEMQDAFAAAGTTVERLRGDVTPIDLTAQLASLRGDRPIEFVRTRQEFYAGLAVARGRKLALPLTAASSAVNVQTRQDGTIAARRDGSGFEWLLLSGRVRTQPNCAYRVTLDVSFSSGAYATYVLRADNTPLATLVRSSSHGPDRQSAVVIPGESESLFVVIAAYNPAGPRSVSVQASPVAVEPVSLPFVERLDCASGAPADVSSDVR